MTFADGIIGSMPQHVAHEHENEGDPVKLLKSIMGREEHETGQVPEVTEPPTPPRQALGALYEQIRDCIGRQRDLEKHHRAAEEADRTVKGCEAAIDQHNESQRDALTTALRSGQTELALKSEELILLQDRLDHARARAIELRKLAAATEPIWHDVQSELGALQRQVTPLIVKVLIEEGDAHVAEYLRLIRAAAEVEAKSLGLLDALKKIDPAIADIGRLGRMMHTVHAPSTADRHEVEKVRQRARELHNLLQYDASAEV